jgi:antitoxin (DNA-binding transcriptional repressor) of toxin-antitoxin stability system
MPTTSSPVQTVNIYQAKTQLSKIIARNGKPVARLTTIEQPKKKPIVYGLLEGKGWIADDFDDPLPEEIQKYFEGRGDDE